MIEIQRAHFCANPWRCKWQATCCRNENNWGGPEPEVKVYDTYRPSTLSCKGYCQSDLQVVNHTYRGENEASKQE